MINFDASTLFKDVQIQSSKFIIYSVSDLVFNNANISTTASDCTVEQPRVKYPTQFLAIKYNNENKINASVSILNSSFSELDNLIYLSLMSSIGIYSLKGVSLIESYIKGSNINLVSSDLVIDNSSSVSS